MKKIIFLFFPVFILFLFCGTAFSEDQEERLLQNIKITPGFGFEYFNYLIEWDEEPYIVQDTEDNTTNLKSYLFTLSSEFNLFKKVSLTPYVGYSLSNYDLLTFRGLPFSVRLDVGFTKGIVLGCEISADAFKMSDFHLGIIGSFSYFIGFKNQWEIESLTVDGTLEGKPSWLRYKIGPVLTYKGINNLYPFFKVQYHKLWGKYTIDETIGNLKGNEERSFSGKSAIIPSLGIIYEISDSFSIYAEFNSMLSANHLDYGLHIKFVYAY